MPHLHGVGGSVCWEVCANAVCITCRTPDPKVGLPCKMAEPPGCCHSCATCLLCLYSCQWITAKEKRKGLRTTKVIPRVMLS